MIVNPIRRMGTESIVWHRLPKEVRATLSSEALTVRIAPGLRTLLSGRRRQDTFRVALDGCSSLVHVIESLGVPRTEIGGLLVGGLRVDGTRVLQNPAEVEVEPVDRPQPVALIRFVLDVHLGALARRMRLVGLDTA